MELRHESHYEAGIESSSFRERRSQQIFLQFADQGTLNFRRSMIFLKVSSGNVYAGLGCVYYARMQTNTVTLDDESDYDLITDEQLDVLLDAWARWSAGVYDQRRSGAHVLAVAAHRKRAQYTRADLLKQVAREKGLHQNDPGLELQIPWMKDPKPRPVYTPMASDPRHDSYCLRVDLAIRMMRDSYNLPKQGRLSGYGDRLYNVLKTSLTSNLPPHVVIAEMARNNGISERRVYEWIAVARHGVKTAWARLEAMSMAV